MELTATAYERVCAGVVYTQRRNKVLGILGDVGAVALPEGIEAQLQQLEKVISTGRAVEDTICRYADWLVSTTNTRSSAEREAGPGGIPDPNPSSVNPLREGLFQNESAATDNFDGVVNYVQRHKCRPEGYCKRKVSAGAGVPAAFECRFGYPSAECGQTRLEFNELDNGGVKADIVTRRNEGNMNNHNRVLLQNWRANVGIQLLIDWEDTVRYMVEYVSKQEKRSQPILDLFKATVCRDGYDDTVGTETRLRKVFLKAVGERDITAQETNRLLLRGIFSSSTFNYKRLNVDPDQQSRAIRLQNGTGREGSIAGGGQRTLGMTYLERYAGRAYFLSEYPDVTTLNAYEFTRTFKTINGKLQREPGPADIIVVKLPVIDATKGSRNYTLCCRNNLVAHRPWNGRVEDAWRDKD